MLDRFEQLTFALEEKVEEKTLRIEAEKSRADNLLYQMLPKSVADALKRNTV